MSGAIKEVTDSMLGREVNYPHSYNPKLLYRVARVARSSRHQIYGFDRWVSYEFTCLRAKGSALCCALEIKVPASSNFIVESKSLKLYLGSFAQEKFSHSEEFIEKIKYDLGKLLESQNITVNMLSLADLQKSQIITAPGNSIDREDITCSQYNNPKSTMLITSPELTTSTEFVSESLSTDSFRSICPVTAQPDYASVLIEYKGNKIDQTALLRYLIAYRNHAGFHETCCEKIFEDISEACQPKELNVACFFNRRGGIEINPIRSSAAIEGSKYNYRLARQ